jgi:hypothetical protein
MSHTSSSLPSLFARSGPIAGLSRVPSRLGSVLPPSMLARRSVRRQVQVACEAVWLEPFVRIGTSLLDVSPHGARIVLDPAFASQREALLDASVMVSFQVGELGLWFDLEAQVARMTGGRRARDSAPSVAVAFTCITSLERRVLSAATHRFAAVPWTTRRQGPEGTFCLAKLPPAIRHLHSAGILLKPYQSAGVSQ